MIHTNPKTVVLRCAVKEDGTKPAFHGACRPASEFESKEIAMFVFVAKVYKKRIFPVNQINGRP